MIRAAILALLPVAASAASIPAIQIQECVQISVKEEQRFDGGRVVRDYVSRVEHCYWPGPPVNPLPYIASLDLKGPHETPNPLAALAPVAWPAASSPPREAAIRATGGTSGADTFGAGVPPFYSPHIYGCCDAVWKPETPEPSPVPLPASLGLYAALLAALVMWGRR